MATLGARLRQAREASGLSQSALARALSVRSQTINQWEHDKKKPSRENLVAFVRATNSDVAWLLYGQPALREQSGNAIVPPVGTRGRFVALVSVRAAAARQLDATPEGQIFAHFPAGETAKAITLPNDSNAPQHPAGTVWIVDYDIQAEPGDMVLGRYGPDLDPIMGEYRVQSGPRGRVEIIAPLNATRWPEARSDIGTVEVVAVMTESHHPGRRK